MKLVTTIVSLFLFTLINAQPPPPPEEIILGKKGFTSLMGLPNFAWYDTNIAKAKADTTPCKACAEIKTIKQPYKIVVVGGTWCSDTQDLLPKFFVAMQRAKIEPDKVAELYFIDRDKKEPADIVAKYNIVSIPTFIVYDSKGAEVGRVVESVKTSIEADILELLKKLPL